MLLSVSKIYIYTCIVMIYFNTIIGGIIINTLSLVSR